MSRASESRGWSVLGARPWFVICGLTLACCNAPARADITVNATLRPQRIQVGESATLVIAIGGAQDVEAPTLSGLTGFDARYVGPSTQISFINGRVSASVEHRYSLLALQPGHFTLGPFTVEYQGKQYQTPTFTIDVAAAGQATGPGTVAGAAAAARPAGGRSDAIRLRLAGPTREVYVHERIPVDVTLSIGAVSVSDVQYPTLAGDAFSIDKFREPTQRQEASAGTTYQVVRFQTTVIPLRSGALTLGPATLRLNVVERRRLGGPFDDPFFDSFMGSRRPLDVHSDPLTVTVLPLPDEGKPADFSGAVGSFTLEVAATPTEVTAGDPITVRMDVRGVGNLADASPPQLTDTTGLRTYEAQATTTDTQAVEAARAFEQVVIANDDRLHALPPVRFSYFDPQARRYQVLESKPIALVIRPAPSNARPEIVAPAAPAGALIPAPVGRDIVYIKDTPGRLVSRRRGLGDAAALLWQPVPAVLFLAAVIYDRRRQRLSGNRAYARFTRAGKEARRGLAGAESALARGDRAAFYDVLSHTMQTYLAAKLDLPPGAIDARAVAAQPLDADAAERLLGFFETCERVRFAPGADDGDMRGTLALARDIVKRLERTRWTSQAGAHSRRP
jgi:hypothetical protein